MRKHLPLLAIVLFSVAAAFGPVVFRSWVLQHDLDGGGHTISNTVFVGDGSGLTGITGGGDTIWTNDGGIYKLIGYASDGVRWNAASGLFTFFRGDTNEGEIRIAVGAGTGNLQVSGYDTNDAEWGFILASDTGGASGNNYFRQYSNDVIVTELDSSGNLSLSGKVSSIAGFSSTDTTAAVNIAATGWTNTFGKNATVYFSGTTVTAIVKNNAGTPVFTNAVAITGMSSVPIQSSGAVVFSGTGVTGTAVTF